MPNGAPARTAPRTLIPEESPHRKPVYAPELPAAAGDRCRTRSRARHGPRIRELAQAQRPSAQEGRATLRVTLSSRRPCAAGRRHGRGRWKKSPTSRDRYSFGELRVSHEQNLIFSDVQLADLHALWQEVRELGFANAQCRPCSPTSSVARAGTSAPRQRQVDPGAEAIQQRFDDLDYLHDTANRSQYSG